MQKFTIQELSSFDGKDNRPAYIAFQGKVYDVTNSYHWNGGVHHVLHTAGKDLTDELKNAPHGEDLFQRVPQVGILISDST